MSLLQKSILRNLLPTAFFYFIFFMFFIFLLLGPGSRWLTGGLVFLRGLFNFYLFLFYSTFLLSTLFVWVYFYFINILYYLSSFLSFFVLLRAFLCLLPPPHCLFHADWWNNCFFLMARWISTWSHIGSIRRGNTSGMTMTMLGPVPTVHLLKLLLSLDANVSHILKTTGPTE